ncbi:MAG: flagellar biosynthesis repressor FlbT [Micavibrio aeruginosavorus]|uniref:Flagellar biosynthesis repressor FlbT n=1 Tax=Micavibrio aeruginosavorus TaxID=349221 RepID=A0A2W5FQ57_9BACT|nr:MAG: flagellar biosynthesis repressor FlbT [Micavibrio aeruginosavorus]
MALIIDLKPGEKILIGTAVITNDSQRTRLHISGEAPILREKDVLQEEDADTPCKKVYFLVQCMYLARNPREYHPKYFEMLKIIQQAAPSTSIFFMRINEQIIQGHYYKALREAKDLITHETELLAGVTLNRDKTSTSH